MSRDHATRSIGSRAASGVLWSVAAMAGAKAASVLAVAVLARLLAPQHFGLFAFALAFLAYVDTVSDLGMGMALIYWRDRSEDAAQVTFVISVLMSVLLFGLTFALAPVAAGFFHAPSGVPILRALAWSFPIRALGVTHDSLCQKALGFRTRFVPEVALTVVKGLAAILLALAGLGVWSLVYGHLAGLAAWTLLLWVLVPWRPSWHWPSDLLRPMLRYGRSLVAINVVASIAHHADLIVVGRMLGVTALGFYQIAYKIPEIAILFVIRAPAKVLFPAFAAIHSQGGALRGAYTVTLRYVALAAVPMCAALAVLAEPLILVVFGPAWRSSIPILQALAVYTCSRAVGNNAGEVMKAIGRPNLLAMVAFGRAVLLVPVLIFSAAYGPAGVAIAMAVVAAVGMAVHLIIVSRLTKLSGGAILGAIAPSLLVAAGVTTSLLVWRAAVAGVNPPLQLAGGIFLGVLAHAAGARLIMPEAYQHGLRSVRHALGAILRPDGTWLRPRREGAS